jgi:hypothetical protein
VAVNRRLIVAPEAAEALDAAHIAHIESLVDDDDNVCPACGDYIHGEAATVVVFTNERSALVKIAHPECSPSGVYAQPGLESALLRTMTEADGLSLRTQLGARHTPPRALVFIEPPTLVGARGVDPLCAYAEELGLVPIAGDIEEIDVPPVEGLELRSHALGLALVTRHDTEEIHVDADVVSDWAEHAVAGAIVIVARGLGLGSPEPTIEQALRLRPAWGGLVGVRGFDQRAPRRASRSTLPERLAHIKARLGLGSRGA